MQNIDAIKNPNKRLDILFLVGLMPKTNKFELSKIQSNNHEIIISISNPIIIKFCIVVLICHRKMSTNRPDESLQFGVCFSFPSPSLFISAHWLVEVSAYWASDNWRIMLR